MVKRIVVILLIVLSVTFTSSEMKNAQTEKLFNMTYVYFGGPNTYVKQVDNTKESLQVVSPNYFDLTPEGKLDLTWMFSQSFVTEMHKRGIRVVPFLANHWNKDAGINGLNNREQLAQEIANAIEKYNLDGINVDIEGVNHLYRNQHTDFIRLLNQKIPSDKDISVAIAANPNGWSTGWHGFYDEPALSKYADYLMIMAYDESWGGADSPIGPVASLGFQERAIQYVLNKGVPKNKIVLGLPFYGRMWKVDGPTLENINIYGMGLAHTRVHQLVQKYNGKIQFDQNKSSAYVNFTIPHGQEEFQSGVKLTEGNYIVWFDNEQSIKEKLRLPQKYGIKGTGSWALSQETSDMWNYYSLWLNGKFFKDVGNGHWAEKNIVNIANKGWMEGTGSTTFSPEAPLTRAQGAVILTRALGKSNLEPKSYKFTDVKNHWAKKEIEIARELGLVNGIGNDRFGPEEPLTREQLATILYNIFKFDYENLPKSPFPDLAPNHWSYESVMAIYQKGYLTGIEDMNKKITFQPQGKSTRAQMATLMDRMTAEFDAYGSK